MKRFMVAGLAAFMVVLFAAAPSWSDIKSIPGPGKGFGIGVMVGGDMTGLSTKFWTGAESAINLGVAWAPSGGTRFNGDFVMHHPMTAYVPGENAGLSITYGLGVRVLNQQGTSATGLRVPLGLDFSIPGTSMDIYGEIAPTLNLTTNSQVTTESTVGMRFFFF